MKGQKCGIRKLCHFDFSCLSEDGKLMYPDGYCRARKYAAASMPFNEWHVLSLVKENPEICQTCSDQAVSLHTNTVRNVVQGRAVEHSKAQCPISQPGRKRNRAEKDAAPPDDVRRDGCAEVAVDTESADGKADSLEILRNSSMAALMIDGCVHIAACLGRDEDEEGDEHGQWFNSSNKKAPIGKRKYCPAWVDTMDEKEVFTWRPRSDLEPVLGGWRFTDELVPRFKLLASHSIPPDIATKLEEIGIESSKKKKAKK